MGRTSLYVALVRVYYALVAAANRVGGPRVSTLLQRVAVAARYVVFPEYGPPLSGVGPSTVTVHGGQLGTRNW